jgi:hypothetical protein
MSNRVQESSTRIKLCSCVGAVFGCVGETEKIKGSCKADG